MFTPMMAIAITLMLSFSLSLAILITLIDYYYYAISITFTPLLSERHFAAALHAMPTCIYFRAIDDYATLHIY